MDKYIGFDIDSKKTIACVVQKGKKDRFTTLRTDVDEMKKLLMNQRVCGHKLHLTFEIGGEAGYRYDQLEGNDTASQEDSEQGYSGKESCSGALKSERFYASCP